MKLVYDSEEYQPPRSGLILLQCAIGLLFMVFCARFWFLQIHRGADYAREAQGNLLRQEMIFASRGEIHDRAGVLLAENRPAFALALTREDCYDIPATLAQVSAWLDVPLEKVTTRYEQERIKGRKFDPIILFTDIPFEKIASIEAELIHWPGLQVIARSLRHYTQGPAFAHILGYVAEASVEELQSDSTLVLGDTVGRQGLERVLESRLRGRKGLVRKEVDALGRPLSRTQEENPTSGENIALALDSRLQNAIMDAMGEYSGCVVVMEPESGKLRALVTKPTYDNNIFIGGLSRRDWEALSNNPRYPLLNRGIQSVYPPGSVWKLMMSSMLLEKGVSPREKVFCPGSYKVGNRVFRCWRGGGHGNVDMEHALIGSCDVYFYAMGEKYGINAIEQHARACGYGQLTGIDLPYENKGLVPSRQWKKNRMGESWKDGDTVNVSIGQGHTLVTPIQTAVFLSALCNGGKLLKPQLLEDAPVEVRGEIPVSAEHREMILDYMVKTVEAPGATARVLKRPDMRIGGKTGTAQVVKRRMVGERRAKTAEMEFLERDHAWIGSWGEKDGRKIVVVTMLEHGGGGSSAAGPVTKAVYDILFPREEKPDSAS